MAQVLPFNGFYAGDSKKNSSRTCVNYMPVRHDAGSLSEYTLDTTTGITSSSPKVITNPGFLASSPFIFDVTTGVTDGSACAVYSQGFLMVSNGDGYSIKDLGTGSIFIFDAMTSKNKDVVLIVDKIGGQATNQNIYTYTASTDTGATLDISAQLGTNTRFRDTAYFGDRFLLMSYDVPARKGLIYYSAINDATTFDGDFFSSIEQTGDSTGIHVLSERLYLFTDSEYSVWVNTPSVNSPFSQQKGSAGNLGLLNMSAKAELGGKLFLVGKESSSLGFYVFTGGGYQKISTEYIDQDIAGEKSANVFTFSDSGRDFVGFTLDKTYCLDVKTGEFHIRSSNGGKWHGAGSILTVNGNNVFYGTETTSPIAGRYLIQNGKEDNTLGTEFGLSVDRECVTSPFNSDGVTNNVRELAFQTDIDYTTFDANLDHPQLSLEVSKDFGYSYETARFSEFENIGEPDRLLRFMNIGFFRQAFVFRISTSIKYPHKILKMLTRLEKGFRQL